MCVCLEYNWRIRAQKHITESKHYIKATVLVTRLATLSSLEGATELKYLHQIGPLEVPFPMASFFAQVSVSGRNHGL